MNHLRENGYVMRVINRDSTPRMVTTDVNEKRVNVFIMNGYVSDINNIG